MSNLREFFAPVYENHRITCLLCMPMNPQEGLFLAYKSNMTAQHRKACHIAAEHTKVRFKNLGEVIRTLRAGGYITKNEDGVEMVKVRRKRRNDCFDLTLNGEMNREGQTVQDMSAKSNSENLASRSDVACNEQEEAKVPMECQCESSETCEKTEATKILLLVELAQLRDKPKKEQAKKENFLTPCGEIGEENNHECTPDMTTTINDEEAHSLKMAKVSELENFQVSSRGLLCPRPVIFPVVKAEPANRCLTSWGEPSPRTTAFPDWLESGSWRLSWDQVPESLPPPSFWDEGDA